MPISTSYLPITATVPQIIRSCRESQNLSMREFAEMLGNISHNSISQWERGVAEPDRTRVSEWFHSDEDWKYHLALDIFTVWYRDAMAFARQPAALAA